MQFSKTMASGFNNKASSYFHARRNTTFAKTAQLNQNSTMIEKVGGVNDTSPRTKRKDLAINKQSSSVTNTEVSRKKPIKDLNPSYADLNAQLMFPKNPVYSLVKKGTTSDTIQAQQERDRQENKKMKTFLDYCREQSIAFTDTDKVMYNLQQSKDLHYILDKFI